MPPPLSLMVAAGLWAAEAVVAITRSSTKMNERIRIVAIALLSSPINTVSNDRRSYGVQKVTERNDQIQASGRPRRGVQRCVHAASQPIFPGESRPPPIQKGAAAKDRRASPSGSGPGNLAEADFRLSPNLLCRIIGRKYPSVVRRLVPRLERATLARASRALWHAPIQRLKSSRAVVASGIFWSQALFSKRGLDCEVKKSWTSE